MKKALCTKNADGSFSIQIDGDLAKGIGFTDQMVAEASFNSNGDLVVTPYRDPVRQAEMKALIEKNVKKYQDLLNIIKEELDD